MNNVELAEGLLSSPAWDSLVKDIMTIHGDSEKYPNWQITTISGLIFTLRHEYECLTGLPRIGLKSMSRLAFHSRNLFELAIWCIACEKDPAILRTLYEDAGRDAKDLIKAFEKWGVIAQQDESYFEDMNKKNEDLEKVATEAGVLNLEEKYTKIRNLADTIGMGEDYDIIYKFLSKFSHPTALQIIGEFPREGWFNLNTVIYEHGCVNFIGAFQALKKLVNELMNRRS